MGSRREPFRCEIVPDREQVRVRPVGELDLATCDEVSARLDEVRRAGFDHIVLDLRALDFMDSTGVKLIVQWTQAAGQDGFRFELGRGAPPQVMRVLELTGLAPRLPFA